MNYFLIIIGMLLIPGEVYSSSAGISLGNDTKMGVVDRSVCSISEDDLYKLYRSYRVALKEEYILYYERRCCMNQMQGVRMLSTDLILRYHFTFRHTERGHAIHSGATNHQLSALVFKATSR